MAINNIELLKFHLQEKQFPYFSDEDLQLLLEEYPDINEAIYEGCLIKAQDDSVKLGPINTPSNEQYWIRRAKHFRAKIARFKVNATGCVARMDEY